jgi:predicted  nucleic acid-binding Zn-ribbon protein
MLLYWYGMGGLSRKMSLVYSKSMDYRKKNIKDLERKKQESRLSLDVLLEDFGRLLLDRLGEDDFPSEETGAYRRLRKEAGDSEALIKTVEEDTLRLRGLEEEINLKEEQNTALVRELSDLSVRLGKHILEDPQYEGISGFYRQRADILGVKTDSLAGRLAELEAGEGANVFTWIGKKAQGLVTRSFLTKAQDNLERLYQAAGEDFSRSGSASFQGEAAGLAGEIEKKRGLLQALAGELAELRGERRKLGKAFGAEGGPVKQIQGLERHINHIREELKAVCRRFGGQAAEPGAKKQFASLLSEDDQQVLEKIRFIRKTIQAYDTEIKGLKNALAADEKKAEIEKWEKAIQEQRGRITAAEESIAELENRIQEAEKNIEELEKPI